MTALLPAHVLHIAKRMKEKEDENANLVTKKEEASVEDILNKLERKIKNRDRAAIVSAGWWRTEPFCRQVGVGRGLRVGRFVEHWPSCRKIGDGSSTTSTSAIPQFKLAPNLV